MATGLAAASGTISALPLATAYLAANLYNYFTPTVKDIDIIEIDHSASRSNFDNSFNSNRQPDNSSISNIEFEPTPLSEVEEFSRALNDHLTTPPDQKVSFDNIDNYKKTPCGICLETPKEIYFHCNNTNKTKLVQCGYSMCSQCLGKTYKCTSCRKLIEL